MRLYNRMNQRHGHIRRVRIGDALTLHVRSYDHLQIVYVIDFIHKQFSKPANQTESCGHHLPIAYALCYIAFARVGRWIHTREQSKVRVYLDGLCVRIFVKHALVVVGAQ